MAGNRFTHTPVEQPFDVRLMNSVASMMLSAAALAVLVLLVMWLARLPVFSLQGIRVEGDVGRSSEATLRANAAPRLAGNFFTIDLDAGRQAFEAVPWVRHATVSREWPNRLAVKLEEHVAAALWQPEGSSASATDLLVNTFGETFATNLGELDDDTLPTLSGPKGSSPALLEMLQALTPELARIGDEIDTLAMSSRGSWRAELASGAVIELGRGKHEEIVTRCKRFVDTMPSVTARYQRALQFADLRHRDGYAVRLRGISTTHAEPNKTPRK